MFIVAGIFCVICYLVLAHYGLEMSGYLSKQKFAPSYSSPICKFWSALPNFLNHLF